MFFNVKINIYFGNKIFCLILSYYYLAIFDKIGKIEICGITYILVDNVTNSLIESCKSNKIKDMRKKDSSFAVLFCFERGLFFYA